MTKNLATAFLLLFLAHFDAPQAGRDYDWIGYPDPYLITIWGDILQQSMRTSQERDASLSSPDTIGAGFIPGLVEQISQNIRVSMQAALPTERPSGPAEQTTRSALVNPTHELRQRRGGDQYERAENKADTERKPDKKND